MYKRSFINALGIVRIEMISVVWLAWRLTIKLINLNLHLILKYIHLSVDRNRIQS